MKMREMSSDALSESSSYSSEYNSVGDQKTVTSATVGLSSRRSSHRSVSSGSNTGSSFDIARNETIAVNRSKGLVYVALLCAATGIAVATYFLVASQEQENFENDFRQYAEEVHDRAESNARNAFGQVHSLSTSLTSFALSRRDDSDDEKNDWWPFVTLSHFDMHSTEAEMLSGAEDIAFAPIVEAKQKDAWEAYAWENQGWIAEDLHYRGWDSKVDPGNISTKVYNYTGHDDSEEILLDDDHIMTENDESATTDPGAAESSKHLRRKLELYRYPHVRSMHVPVWQMGPVPLNATIVNLDLYTHPSFQRMIRDVLEIEHVLLSEVVDLNFIISHSKIDHSHDGHPRSYVLQPVFDDFGTDGLVVGFLAAVLPWQSFFVDILPEGISGLDVEVRDTCGSEFTYEILGHNATFFGQGDLHDPKYEYLVETYEFALEARYDGHADDDLLSGVHCEYSMRIFPSDLFHDPYTTSKPWVYAIAVLLVFLFTIAVFALYDFFVQKRQSTVLSRAKHTTKIVASLFPKSVRKRIMDEAVQEAEREEQEAGKSITMSFRSRASLFSSSRKELRDFLGESFVSKVDGGEDGQRAEAGVAATKPIADLFPATTIMFADLVGFTAWSSMRKPDQVFTLLETIYHHFDDIARRRRVFKVETVGDCYVAVAGLPEPRRDHATVMARFARDCLYKLHSVTKQLEVSLGPDTTDLGLRVGLHSGPVTAGVLRGERSRFQLFGDTMNTTARIESTGISNKIHISSETASILRESGKGHWLHPREEKVTAKGKGELQTYWLELRGDTAQSSHSGSCRSLSLSDVDDAAAMKAGAELAALKGSLHDSGSKLPKYSDRDNRLIDWNRAVLVKLLKQIVARRESAGIRPDDSGTMASVEQEKLFRDHTVLEEVKEVITLPKFDAVAARSERPVQDIELSEIVVSQLRSYIETIAAMYHDANPFHNFQHVSHVSMSVVKLLSRIVAPEMDEEGTMREGETEVCGDRDDTDHAFGRLHDHTYGITSDPLTQFAVVFSAMIHDVDHPGVPNAQLVQEKASIAEAYKNKSVAEQNSVDLAWDLLMDSNYADLRRTIYATKAEFLRFRQLVVNSVMATDIMDKDLGNLRKARWDRAFSEEEESVATPDDHEHEDVGVNRKATIVIEHLIQASDVAHTMQHWHIYRKWNARLFAELRRAWKDGRADKDPATFWYKGEIGFFDFYIIPLAKKLKECGVFGVSSDEYLNYAQQNRQEWDIKGEAIVAEMLESEGGQP